MYYFWLLPLLFIVIGLWLLRWGRQSRQQSGLPTGEITYSDTGMWEKVSDPLISRRYGLVGKPDYLVEVRTKGRTMQIPVEVKSGKRPAAPREGHILQLGAYCLLVEEQYGITPAYGLLHYADATLQIDFTASLRRQVIEVADAIRRHQQTHDVARTHQDPLRCRNCGYQQACGPARLA
ncbi:MAG: CRISPR-associated protein Cas4 [Caldilineaceae bacterium]